MGIKKVVKTIWKGILTLLKGIRNVIEVITEKPIIIGVLLFILIGYFVINITLKRGDSYEGEFLKNILIEAHGLLFDVFVFGVLIVIFNKIGEKKREIRRYKEEIDDYRGWDEKEASYRIAGNIRRLNKRGVTKINLFDCYLVNARLSKADLQGANLENANLQKAYLVLANLKEANLEDANLQGADLVGASLQKAYLEVADLQGADLVRANLKEANLDGASLNNAHLRSVNLQKAYLESAQLQDANLESANLQNANLESADLQGVVLQEANLRDANLENANLQGANFESANLQGAKLWEANLQGANFMHTNLLGTENVTIDQLSKAKTLYEAKLDPELEKEIREKYPHLLEKPEEME